MGKAKATVEYHCDDDCVPSGCPKHKIEISYNSVTNCYAIVTEDGVQYYDQNKLEALLKAVFILGKLRRDTIKCTFPVLPQPTLNEGE